MSVEAKNYLTNVLSKVTADYLPLYTRLRSKGDIAMTAENTVHMNAVQCRISQSDFARTSKGMIQTSQEPILRAVVTSMLVADRAPRYPRKNMNTIETMISNGILPRSLESFITETSGALNELVPLTRTRFTQADLRGWREMGSDANIGNEMLVVTGLNGCGKTTVINMLTGYLDTLGIPAKPIKSPNPEGVVFQKILGDALAKKVKLPGESIQYLFLADMMDILRNLDPNNPIQIMDRLAHIEGQVFSPDLTKIASLIAGEAIGMPLNVVVIDRSPTACFLQVRSRTTEARIFEDTPDKMIRQQVELWRLINLGGNVSIVNTDSDHNNIAQAVAFAGYRTIRPLIENGLIPRALLRLGRFSDINEARSVALMTYEKWFENIRPRN